MHVLHASLFYILTDRYQYVMNWLRQAHKKPTVPLVMEPAGMPAVFAQYCLAGVG